VSDECIHGFVDGLCATCNPKPVPESAASTRPASRTRVATAPRATVRSLRAAARIPVGTAPADNLLEQRIYHVTHVSNLPAILASGSLAAGSTPALELSPDAARLERGEIPIPGGPADMLAEYVPFFLTPDAQLWQTLRSGDEHPRISSKARAADTYDFVFLVSTVKHVVNAGAAFVVADRNSEGSTTRFAISREDAERMLHRLRSDNGGEQLLDAELLVADRLPLESVTLVGVANDRVRQVVRDMLAGSEFTPKISVYPPWFQQPE
jgi:hypothetical protein